MRSMTRRSFLRHVGATAVMAGAAGGGIWRPSWAETSADPMIALFSELVADLEQTFPYASVLWAATDGISMARDRDGTEITFARGRGHGASIRIWDGESFHEVASSDVSPDALRASVLQLKRDVAPIKERFRIERLPALEQSWATPLEIDPQSLTLEQRAAALNEQFAEVNWDDPRVRTVRLSTDETRARRIFVDRTRRLRSDRVQISHGAFLFGFAQGKPGFANIRHVRQGGYEHAKFDEEEIERLRSELIELFRAEPVPAGEYDVILAPPVTGLLAHESFGHGVEMDQFVKDRAKARHFIGKPVAASIVSLSDDPTLPGERGSYPFDDEGMLSSPTRVIERGIFVSPITDLMSATFLAHARTPNGRTESWDRKVYARMSNTFIERGETDPAEMLAGLSEGLYLDGFRNGVEDPQGWGIQFTTRVAREVKGGKLTGKIFTPITVSGYVPEILGNVTQVGNDFWIEPGSCGKGFKEFVPVGSGGPSVRTRARIS